MPYVCQLIATVRVRRATVACSVCLCLLVSFDCRAADETTDAFRAPLAPAVLLFHKPHHNNGPEQVERIAAAGFDRLQVVATLSVRIDHGRGVQQFGRHAGGRYRPLNAEALAAFREQLTATFHAAAERGMRVAVVAHLNSAGPVHDWRNNFLFDPLADYGGYTYQQAMIEPIVDALTATSLAQQPVDIAIAGEMGRTLFAYPESYIALIDQLQTTGRLPHARVGVSVNFTHVAGEGQSPTGPHTPVRQLPVQQLFDACDFLGMSNYRWFEPPPQPEQFRTAIDALLTELATHGVVWDRNKPVQFTEIGLGGGMPGPRIAATPQLAAKTPWEGFGPRRPNPWHDAALAQLRRDYHRALLHFLQTQTKLPHVTAAFLWSEGSWDPIGTIDSGYEDRVLVEMIKQHNAQVEAAQP